MSIVFSQTPTHRRRPAFPALKRALVACRIGLSLLPFTFFFFVPVCDCWLARVCECVHVTSFRKQPPKKNKLCVWLGSGNAASTIPIPATSSTSSTSSSSASTTSSATSPPSPSALSSGGGKTLKVEPGSGSGGGGGGPARPSSADEGAIISSHDGRQLASPHHHHHHHHQHHQHHQQHQQQQQQHQQNNSRDGELSPNPSSSPQTNFFVSRPTIFQVTKHTQVQSSQETKKKYKFLFINKHRHAVKQMVPYNSAPSKSPWNYFSTQNTSFTIAPNSTKCVPHLVMFEISHNPRAVLVVWTRLA